MRFLLAFIPLLLVSSVAGSASAQTTDPSGQSPDGKPPKKKKKKKKKKPTAQPQPTPNNGDDDDTPGDDDDKPPPDYHGGGDKPPPDYHGGGDKPPPDYHGGGDKPPPDYHGSSTKLNTDLKETGSSSTNGGEKNPWAASGLVKNKNGDNSSSSSDDSKPNRGEFPARGKISAEAFGGYASADLRIGFGFRGGYTLDNHVYLGGAFTYHLGTRFGTLTDTFWYPAVEGGYDYRATELITLHPYAGLGLGIAHASDSSNVLVQASTNASFVFYPGAQFDFQLPHSPVYIGADIRVVIAAGSGAPDPSFGFFILAGGRF